MMVRLEFLKACTVVGQKCTDLKPKSGGFRANAFPDFHAAALRNKIMQSRLKEIFLPIDVITERIWRNIILNGFNDYVYKSYFTNISFFLYVCKSVSIIENVKEKCFMKN